MKIFDPHIRSQTQGDDDLENLRYFGTHAVVTTAHGGQNFEAAAELITYFETLIGTECRRLARCGFDAYAAVGIVPDARPRRAHYEVFERLPELLKRPNVVALGEIGVWEDEPEQWELFERQIRIAQDVGPLPVLITPPARLKLTLTYKMMTRLKRMGYPKSLVMMNYLDDRLARNVLDSGFCAGFPVGVTSNDPRRAGQFLADLVERTEGVDRILLTAALRQSGGDILGVPKTIEALQAEQVRDSLIRKMVYDNAARLFDLRREAESER